MKYTEQELFVIGEILKIVSVAYGHLPASQILLTYSNNSGLMVIGTIEDRNKNNIMTVASSAAIYEDIFTKSVKDGKLMLMKYLDLEKTYITLDLIINDVMAQAAKDHNDEIIQHLFPFIIKSYAHEFISKHYKNYGFIKIGDIDVTNQYGRGYDITIDYTHNPDILDENKIPLVGSNPDSCVKGKIKFSQQTGNANKFVVSLTSPGCGDVTMMLLVSPPFKDYEFNTYCRTIAINKMRNKGGKAVSNKEKMGTDELELFLKAWMTTVSNKCNIHSYIDNESDQIRININHPDFSHSIELIYYIQTKSYRFNLTINRAISEINQDIEIGKYQSEGTIMKAYMAIHPMITKMLYSNKTAEDIVKAIETIAQNNPTDIAKYISNNI